MRRTLGLSAFVALLAGCTTLADIEESILGPLPPELTPEAQAQAAAAPIALPPAMTPE